MLVLRKYVLVVLASLSINAYALEPLELEDAQAIKRYDHLVKTLRCLVCQNQSLADSNAPLAADMRKVIVNMIQDNASDKEIYTFMTDRYGDFVLLQPRLTTANLFLWLGPLVVLLITLCLLPKLIKKPKQLALDEDQRKKAQKLLTKQ